MKRHNKRNVYILLAFVMLVAFVIALYCIYNKTILTIDEPASLSESNCREYYGWFNYPETGWLTKESWNNLIVTDHPFDFANVFYNMSCDNHPVLYHSVIHFMYSLVPYTYSMWPALIPNLVSYMISGLAIFFISNHLTKNGYASVMITAFYLFNPLVINNMLLIRMYMMTEMFVTVFTLLAIRIVSNDNNIWNYLLLGLITTCGCLSHYFFYFAMAFISIMVAVYLIAKRQFKKLFIALFAVIAGILLGFLIYPTMYTHLFGGTGDSSVAGAYLTNWAHYPARWNVLWYTNPFKKFAVILFAAELLFLIIILVMNHGHAGEQLPLAILILLGTFAYFGLCSGISAYADHRYISPVDGVFIASSLCVLYLEIKQLNLLYKNVYFLAGCAILTCVLFFFTLDFSVFDDQYKNSGIEMSKLKKDDICIMISNDKGPNTTNQYMFELSNYKKVYMLDITDIAAYEKIETEGESVIYVEDGLDDKSVMNWLKEYTSYDSLTPVSYSTYNYSLYVTK